VSCHVTADGWVDRARLDVWAGDPDPYLAAAYKILHDAVDARRAAHDQQFAALLGQTTAADSAPDTMLRVEDVLARVVRPILDAGQRVLLLVVDGMGVVASTELVQSVIDQRWIELTPDGGARVGVLAALPTAGGRRTSRPATASCCSPGRGSRSAAVASCCPGGKRCGTRPARPATTAAPARPRR
jgi:hypothetical protein